MSLLDSRTRVARQGFGKPVLRQEGARLLVGAGCFSDDMNLPATSARVWHAIRRAMRREGGS